MRIGIDARFVGPQGTGLGKYTEKLIENLSQIDKKNQYVIFLKKENLNWGKLGPNFTRVEADIPWYSIEEQILLPQIFQKEKLDVLHIPHFNVPILYKGKIIVTIHDLIHHHFSETSATTKNQIIFKTKRIAYKLIISQSVKKAQKIITPSSYVKDEVVKYFKVAPDKITVTYEAAEEEYFKETAKIKPKILNFDIKSPFILYVGNAYPHKNLNNLLEAFKILNSQFSTLNLVIVCARDVFANRLEEKVAKLHLEKSVQMPGYIKPGDLSVIFKKAQAYISPTLSEGFGIPGLNAMASGLPVICSDIPILKEVYKDAAHYFNPKDPKDMAEKISQVLRDSKLSSRLSQNGLKLAKTYSWSKMARQTLKIYESV